MQSPKMNYKLLIVLVLVLFFVGWFFMNKKQTELSLSELGMQSMIKPDCSSVKDSNSQNYPVSVSFGVKNVSDMHDKVKDLIKKFNGQISSDSFNSYPSYQAVPMTLENGAKATQTSQDSANFTVYFDKPDEFLSALSNLVKDNGGKNTAYNYSDGVQYGGGYSTYNSCQSFLQNIQTDVLQLSIFTKALREERSSANISIISQSIANTKSNLQNDISSFNNFFSTVNKPTVNISINSL